MKNNTFKITTILILSVLTVSLVSGFLANDDSNDWFVFNPNNDFREPSEINMKSWLDAPAGKHGFVTMNGNNLAFEDDVPVKFWGVNICSNKPFVDNTSANQYVDLLSFMGINGVRFHKFTWEATDEQYSSIPDSTKFTRMDYFQTKLKERGIYYGWSHIYGHRVKPKDSTRLLAYKEIATLKYPWAHLNGSSSSLVNFSKDLQNLNIELTVNMLNRRNSQTGIRYADDPALSFVEFQNEDNIFWGAIEKGLEQAPTYRALLCKMFSEWLLEKYDNDRNLKKAWGKRLPDGETIAKKNIYPRPNHGIFSSEYYKSLEEERKIPQDVLDKMSFLYETQLEFYERFEKAIRDTGYKGLILSSNWQAGSGMSHLYNLHTDYSVGPIDRHNYYGGGSGGHVLDTGKVSNTAMVSRPGSGLLSTGMQQVSDRPFFISEWMSLIPNEYTAESSPIIATYGMGLQGWDASYSFAVDFPEYSNTLQTRYGGVYNVTSPLQMALYPALTAMVYRGDIREAPLVAERNVHVPSLYDGKLGFVEKIQQDHDQKTFSGLVPPEVLAYGKAPILFTDVYRQTKPFTLEWAHNDGENNIISITNELKWDYSEKGFITINTKGTKGIVGFTKGKQIELDEWKLKTENDFSVILVTSLDEKKGIGESKKILITAIGRARNTGMKYNEYGTILLDKGEAPIEMEAINFDLSTNRVDLPRIKVLDHMGRPTGTEIPFEKGMVRIKGSKYKTIYYLLEY